MLRREQSRFPGKRKETMLNRNMRNTAILLVVFLAVYMFGNYFAEKNLMSGSGSSSYSYERLESDIAKNKVKSIEVVQNAQVPTGSAIVKLNDGEKKVAHVTDVNKVIDLAQQYKVSCQVDDVKSSDAGWLSMILPWIVIGVIMMFMFGMISRASGGGGGGNKMMNFGKSRAKMQDPESQNIRFDQVAGLQEEKEELKEIVDFLKSPQKYIEVGARIPKGVILVGPPGTGKTLLAKAVAGEANVPFFSMSGSEFVEMFVGVGASRVRDLFEQGKRSAPCIIFIDELDAVGRTRGAGYGGGHDEREQTLNQMLVEMDGFNTDTRIIIFAATNRPDVLDPALLRPGRFDRQVVVDLPDVKGREGIFKVHVSKIQHDPSIDLYHLARATPGFSGADIANMVNEAALIAARNDKPRVELPDFEEARDKVMMGPERRSILISEREKLNTAYHEAGHTLMAVLLQNTDSLHKVTIVPRGRSLGATWTLPSDGRYTLQRKKAIDEMSLLLGGRVAEEFKFGEDSVTTGASNDIERVTEMARRMVCEWGMSKLGPIAFGQKEQPIFLGKEIARHKDYSEETAQKIDEEVHRFVMKAYERTQRLLKENSDKFESLAKELFEKESLDIEDIERICEVKLDRVKDKLVYAGKDPKRGTDELEDSDYQDRDVKSVKEEVFNSPLKTIKKSEDEEKSAKMIKKTTSMKKINPKKKKEE